MFWTPRLSAMTIPLSVRMMSSSILRSDVPRWLLCEVAVDSAGSLLGMSRRLTPWGLRVDLRIRPIF